MSTMSASIAQPAQTGIDEFMIAMTAGSWTRKDPPSPRSASCTPWNPRKRPRVTTNEGMPILATQYPMKRPITTPVTSATPSAGCQAH